MPLARIVAVPRNGYVNRLQAWASTSALGDHWQVPVALCWDPESIAPATVHDLFDEAKVDDLIDPAELTELLGYQHPDHPRYLTHIPERDLIVLAGHDRGEQVFMEDLAELVRVSPPRTQLIIIAGGHFGVTDAISQRAQRCAFYGKLPWSRAILQHSESLIHEHGDFLGLHIRTTDRSRQAPTNRQIVHALQDVRTETGLSSIFLAGDTREAFETWAIRVAALGIQAWGASTSNRNRESPEAGIEALIEWRVLGHARALVFTEASSFGAEAAVAAGEASVRPLRASAGRQRLRGVADLARATVTLPQRRGWLAQR